MTAKGICIERLQQEDIPTVAKFIGQAFLSDRQTQMKALAEKDPFDMTQHTLDTMPGYLRNPLCHVLKAVDETTGDIMGVCNWCIRSFVPQKLPLFEERVAAARAEERTTAAAAAAASAQDESQEAQRFHQEKEYPTPQMAVEEPDPIKRLVTLTSSDMSAWMHNAMPPGTRCLSVMGLTVAPRFQGRGAGAALLPWGTRVCDNEGVFAWVHSSDPAWGMYAKSGFEVIRRLDLDLDAYAPCEPPGEGPDAKWGSYTFRYMKYFGKKDYGGGVDNKKEEGSVFVA